MSKDRSNTLNQQNRFRLKNKGKSARIALKQAENLHNNVVHLSVVLGCKISPTAADESINQTRISELKIYVAKALIAAGATLLLVTLIFSSALHRISENEHNWVLSAVPILFLLSLAIFAGFILLRVEKSRSLKTLSDFKNEGLETKDMFDEFEAFRIWGFKNTPHIGFALSQDRFLPLPDEVWKNTDLGVILFGTEAQRRHVLNANKFALSSLVINESDWLNFADGRRKEQASINPIPTSEIEAEKSNEALTSKPNIQLSLRQKARGLNTNWCPRLEMICSNPIYLKRYMAKQVNINHIDTDRQPCHKLLVLLEANYEDFDLFFATAPVASSDQDKAQWLDKKVKKALGIFGRKNITRYDQLKIKKWVLLEKYIETTSIISNDELVTAYPALRLFMDSSEIV